MSAYLLNIAETAFPLELVIERDSIGGVAGKAPTVALRDAAFVNKYMDFADGVFKTVGWTTQFASLTDLGDGIYQRLLNVPATTIVNGMVLVAEYRVDDGGDVVGIDFDTLTVDTGIADAVLQLQTSLALANSQIDELWILAGLDKDKPLTVTKTARVAGPIQQTIKKTATTTTVTRKTPC